MTQSSALSGPLHEAGRYLPLFRSSSNSTYHSLALSGIYWGNYVGSPF